MCSTVARITWGTVLDRTGNEIALRCRRLGLDGQRLALSPETVQPVSIRVDGYAAVPDVSVGERVAVHWGDYADVSTTCRCAAWRR
ncbi:DUF6390 family protein [Nocardia gipuzkoensis]|uniref:DUF6390 family protein n=1 Tax=Nocardia gipuzkoensis TaxID=2749991 RepID=UPI003EE38216